MVVTTGDFYVYRHIRLDKNEVFYVGRGKKKAIFNDFKSEYNRAFSKNKRSIFWQRVIYKSEYKIEIIFETESYVEILEKEKEFIKLYGRRDLNKGTLVNLTDGGDGSAGVITSKETGEKISLKKIGVPRSKETKEKLSKLRKNNPLFSGKNHPSYGIVRSKEIVESIASKNRGQKRTEEQKLAMRLKRKTNPPKFSPVKDLITGNKYKTIKEACADLGLNYTSIVNKMIYGTITQLTKITKDEFFKKT